MARHIFQGTFTDGNGKVVSATTTANGVAGLVSVYLAGTATAADIYTEASGGSAVNSVYTDDDGSFEFYVDESDYDLDQKFKIVLSHANFQSQTYDNIPIFTINGNLATLGGLTSVGNLSALGDLTSAADKLPYFTGSEAASVTAFTAFARDLVSKTYSGNASKVPSINATEDDVEISLIDYDNIADRAVKPYHISRHYLFSDHFMGASINDHLWSTTLVNSGYGEIVTGGHQGNYRIGSGGTANSSAILYVEKATIGAGNKCTLEASVALTEQTYVEATFLELYYDANNLIRFWFDYSTGTHLLGQCISGGSTTDLDLGQTISDMTTMKILKMVVDPASAVEFWYQGSKLDEITTNIPSQDMTIRARIADENYASDRRMVFDYYRAWLDSAETY